MMDLEGGLGPSITPQQAPIGSANLLGQDAAVSPGAQVKGMCWYQQELSYLPMST